MRDFQIEVSNGSAQAHVRFYVKLVDEDKGALVAAKEFSATVRAFNDSVEAGVDALKDAFALSSTKMMRWITSRRIIIADASE